MKMFGTKLPEPTDEDRAAAARLNAIAARLRAGTSSDFTDAAPDPLGEAEAAEEPEVVQEPEAATDSSEPHSEE